jgi:hypothetical protein
MVLLVHRELQAPQVLQARLVLLAQLAPPVRMAQTVPLVLQVLLVLMERLVPQVHWGQQAGT